uniref:Uncharacterized protein n=1 Tax=Haptolina brevifila TaxID=156173 RepID=A0A7S2DJ02_9EUKA|mmetsp:Transcript_38259/g.76653  ORF Transcript_38259/g.76653 Transcript_38259/m.76653 type:complete len:219 (+) Transcript_38259:193-849(+)
MPLSCGSSARTPELMPPPPPPPPVMRWAKVVVPARATAPPPPPPRQTLTLKLHQLRMPSLERTPFHMRPRWPGRFGDPIERGAWSATKLPTPWPTPPLLGRPAMASGLRFSIDMTDSVRVRMGSSEGEGARVMEGEKGHVTRWREGKESQERSGPRVASCGWFGLVWVCPAWTLVVGWGLSGVWRVWAPPPVLRLWYPSEMPPHTKRCLRIYGMKKTA